MYWLVSLSITFLINSIDFIEGKFNFVQTFILLDFKLLLISFEKSKLSKIFCHILVAHSGKFFEMDDKIVNFSEFIMNLFKYLIKNCLNSKQRMEIKSTSLSKELFSKI